MANPILANPFSASPFGQPIWANLFLAILVVGGQWFGKFGNPILANPFGLVCCVVVCCCVVVVGEILGPRPSEPDFCWVWTPPFGPHHDTHTQNQMHQPKLDLDKIGRAKTKMAKNGLAQIGHIRMAKRDWSKSVNSKFWASHPSRPTLKGPTFARTVFAHIGRREGGVGDFGPTRTNLCQMFLVRVELASVEWA